jgi:tetratricopeptide (TPR) repeat protein
MSEITLQNYQQKLEQLLQDQRNDEVVQHCRHILQYYPKNVAVYRLMGMALIAGARYTEAGEVFRRVLSVYPDDFQAHVGLSRVAQHERRGEEAIWHLERAFEQEPNNRQLLENLRDLYRQYRGIEQTRFQLTARAVAAQQIRNGLYTQAIDTLQKALQQMPNRIDLKVLLAQVLWENHYNIPAAETALEVLKQMPDCLEANRILTRLWLKEQRPSDAQRYLSRIEAVDPVIAFEIAQNAPPPENAFRLVELDYQREASRQLVSDSPDWLDALGTVEASAEVEAEDDWMNTLLDESPAPSGVNEDSDVLLALDLDDETVDDVGLDAGDDWLKSEPDDELSSLFGDDDWMQTDEAQSGGLKNTGLTGLLSSLEDRKGSSTGLTGLLNALEDESADEPEPEDDWMRALNKPTAPLQDPNAIKPTAPLPGAPELDDEPDPLAWLETPEQTAPTGTLIEDESDPLAWMRDAGIEFVEEAPASMYNPVMDDEDDHRPFNEPTENNPLAWMQNAGIELVDDEPDENVRVRTDDLPSNDSDPLAWMRQAGIEYVDDSLEEDAEDTIELEERGTFATPPGTSEWLASDDQLDELLTLETMAEHGTGALTEQDEDMGDENENDNIPEWLTSDDDDDEWLSSFNQAEDSDESDEDAAALDWMIEPEAEDEAAAMPDWLSSVAPAQPASVEGGGLFDDETVPGDAAVPDWLSAVSPVQSDTNDEADEFAFDFTADTEDDEESEPVSENVPDWLSAVSPAQSDTSDEADEFAFDFTADTEDDEEAEPVSENVPDWLSAVSPGQSDTSDEADEFAFDFTADTEDAE